MKLFVKLDGVLSNMDNCVLEQFAEKGFYRSLKPNFNILCEIKGMISLECDVYVYSVFAHDENDMKEKRDWLKEFLPSLRDDHIIFLPFGVDAVENIIGQYDLHLSDKDCLIDNYLPNVKKWSQEGGTALLYTNQKTTWNGTILDPDNPNLLMNIDFLNDFITKINKKHLTFIYSTDALYDMTVCFKEIQDYVIHPLAEKQFSSRQEMYDFITSNLDSEFCENDAIKIMFDDCTVVAYCNDDNQITIPSILMYYGGYIFCNISYNEADKIISELWGITREESKKTS